MFESTRLQLTTWYLVTIMSISILFSIGIYRGATQEVQRSLRAQQFRIYRSQHPDTLFGEPPHLEDDQQLFQDAKERIGLTLIIINLGIFVIAAGTGYFLAGRTLKPIQTMVDEQNRFITDASHELRTPITTLKAEIEVYMRSKDHNLKESDKLVSSNLEEVNNLSILSENLIQLAQYQKSNGNTMFTDVSLQAVLKDVRKKQYLALKQKSISVEIATDNHIVFGDKEKLVQLFCIILDNAIKYSPRNSQVSIRFSLLDHFVLIKIIDKGAGIDKKDIPFIFDRFYRADLSRTKQKVPGYGLGLSIAKKITDIHNGFIEVTSEPGKETVFTIKLPLK